MYILYTDLLLHVPPTHNTHSNTSFPQCLPPPPIPYACNTLAPNLDVANKMAAIEDIASFNKCLIYVHVVSNSCTQTCVYLHCFV